MQPTTVTLEGQEFPIAIKRHARAKRYTLRYDSEKELIKKLATLPFSIPEKFKISAGIKFLLDKMCAVDKSGRMQK